MVEKTFSVAAELEDGTTKDISVRAQTSGDAFRMVRAMPDVRRVGRVSEGGSRPSPDRSKSVVTEVRSVPSGTSRIGNAISGPRVVLPAPRGGGEQPFRFLQAPPERPQPPAPPAALAAQPAPKAATLAAPVAATAAPEYRIMKSRRRDGQPYLLQRGRWQVVNGKRGFELEWEQGFDTREQAEAHRDSVVPIAAQPATLQQSA